MTRSHPPSRRDFLKHSAAVSLGAIAFPTIVPASALGRDGATAPSERLVVGCIGTGGKGRGLIRDFMNEGDTQVVAACDVDKNHLEQAVQLVNEHYENEDCRAYGDFRDLLACDEIDVVIVATPDHWHALASVAAAKAGKDIYCEKPLANSVGEGRAIVDAVRGNNRILQTGTQERSGDNARYACELVRNGRIGKVHTVRINLPDDDNHHRRARELSYVPIEEPVPEGFDYDFWLGHTPKAPYTDKRTHFWWRFILAYGGGEMTDRGAHVIDIAQLGLGTDDTGPVEYLARGKRIAGSLYDVFWDYLFVNRYANGVTMIGSTETPRGLKFEGDDGWIFIHIHGGRLEASSDSLLEETIGDDEIQLGRSPGHVRDFLDAVKSRCDPVATAEIGHRTGSICHLNNIAMLTGKRLVWNPVAERITNDDDANALLMPCLREPWSF